MKEASIKVTRLIQCVSTDENRTEQRRTEEEEKGYDIT